MEILAELLCNESRVLEKSETLFFFANFTMSIMENYFKEEFKMNMLTKKIVIGGVLYAAAEVSFMMGKGHMLGVLQAYNADALSTAELLAADTRLESRFISKIANLKAKAIERRKKRE